MYRFQWVAATAAVSALCTFWLVTQLHLFNQQQPRQPDPGEITERVAPSDAALHPGVAQWSPGGWSPWPLGVPPMEARISIPVLHPGPVPPCPHGVLCQGKGVGVGGDAAHLPDVCC